MNICFVVHSIASCWNNGNAHFLRGVITALQARGHTVRVLEHARGWSRVNLMRDAGEEALDGCAAAFPDLRPELYRSSRQALALLDAAEPDLVIVHEWNSPQIVDAIGARRRGGAPYVLLFHDTHHRAVSQPEAIAALDLGGYDGVLAFGACIARVYEQLGWGSRVWTWHEAADVRLFRPIDGQPEEGDVVWVGNWGDDERSEEIGEFLLRPASALKLRTKIHGVRYPDDALAELDRRGVRYGGWLANHRVPEVFARHRATVHIPRRPYAEALSGIPTIRVFEALACGIPLVSAPWWDEEELFPLGAFLKARNGEEMTRQLAAVLSDQDLANALRMTGLACIRARHTCDHRADELLQIHRSIVAKKEPELQEAV